MKETITRFGIVAAAAAAGLALAGAAAAVDLRDWGRKLAASERFVVLSQFDSQAVLDKETQLVWQRSPSTSKKSWINAFGTCLGTGFGGRRGWRLPTTEELTSLQVELASGGHALPAGHPFQNVQPVAYLVWTATLHPDYPASYAHAVGMTAGTGSFFDFKTTQNYFWCVRGGAISAY